MIIAGAGIIGLSCAWRLAQNAYPVTLFDAGTPAREASWAGAGMLAPGGEIDSDPEAAALALRSLAQFASFVRELSEETAHRIDYRASGAMEVAFTDEEAAELNERAVRQAALGIRSESAQWRGLPARFYPDDALVNPRDITRALLSTLRYRGKEIYENEPIVGISPSGMVVWSDRRSCFDSGVLIAAGAWSSDLFPGLPRTLPVRGHLISFSMKPGLLEPILRHKNTYLLQRASGVVIAGTSSERVGFDRTVDPAVVTDIHARAVRLLPELQGAPVLDQWVGFRPGIEGERPAIGKLPHASVWTAFGHYRNGILLAPETARLIVESVASA